ncbi:MAG: ABC transporter ATP-binding protein [Pseudonocardiales bacterium]
MNLTAGARLLRHHLSPQRRALYHLAAWSAVEAVPAFLSGLLIAHALDRGFLAGRPLVGFGWLAILALLWVIGALGTRQVFPWLAATVEPLRDALLTTVITASLTRALQGEDVSGPSVSQATVQVETVRALLSSLLRTTRQMLAVSVAAVGGLALLSPLLALIVASFVLLALAGLALLLRILALRYQTVLRCGEQIGALATPVIDGIRDVVAYAAQTRATQDVGQAINAEAAALRAFARVSTLRVPLVTTGAHLPMLALLAISPWLITHHDLTIGQLAGAVLYLFSGLAPAVQIMVNTGSAILVNLAVTLNRLAEISTEPPSSAAPTAKSLPTHHDIDLDNVTFAYSPRAAPIVRDLTLRIPAGTHLAVVGPSGVGKSTLANLLARLTAPQRGELRLGGLTLEQIDEHHLRNAITLIPQEAYIFAGTVRDNLTYLQPQATTADIDHAVTVLGLNDTIARVGGYDSEIPSGGATLSTGERQLIALARAYLSPARIVILDEATCHLDPTAEAKAEQAFATRHSTLIVIAHRISSAQRADHILIMNGTRTTVGTHRDLLTTNHLYATLVKHWNHTDPAPESQESRR